MNGIDYTHKPDHSVRIQSRLSKQQKTMLQRLVNNNPNLKNGTFNVDFSQTSAQRLWTKIAIKLNSIPGAQKTWSQWRKTWQDVKKNARKPQFQSLADCHGSPENIVCDDLRTSDDAKDDDDDVDNDDIQVKQRRAKNMSKTQKKLLYELINSNDKLQQEKSDGPSLSCQTKRKEWKKIALKLNSVTGPQKTWSQWKKCWHDIQKYNVRGDVIENLFHSESELSVDADIAEFKASTYMPSRVKSDNTPSITQINRMIKEIVEQRDTATSIIWTSLSKTLNALGTCTKNCHGWKDVWTAYKRNVQKYVDRNGTKNFDNLQRLTYEYIKRERSKIDLKNSVNSIPTENQIQLLQRTANQECNIIGSLVAVKLRSMQKEQKLIAEKLISEILFQGQMEMFQYSDKAVSIPGYM